MGSLRALLGAVAAATSIFVAAAFGAPLKNPVLGQPQAIAAGRALYAQHCFVCHLNAGGRGPDLFENTLTDEEFFITVASGRSGSRGQMPSWAGILSPQEIWQIEAFVKSRPHF